MMIHIRTYRNDDFSLVCDLLIENMQYDYLTEPLIKEKLYDDPDWSPESIFIAEVNASPAGFLMGVVRNVKGVLIGYIKLMAVNQLQRRRGIATAMYQKLEDYFLRMGVEAVRICDVPFNYLSPGIDPMYTEAICFADKSGFERNGVAVNMKVDLGHSEWSSEEKTATLRTQHIDIRRAGEDDITDLMEFVTKEWELWKFELSMAMKNDPPTVFIATKENRIKAFAAYDGNNLGTGWFGPMGTDTELRGKGIGSILLYKCLADMRDSGLKESTIPWVEPIGFYAHYANARITRTFWRFEKRLFSH